MGFFQSSQFTSRVGLGRTSVTSFALGFFLSMNLMILGLCLIQHTSPRWIPTIFTTVFTSYCTVQYVLYFIGMGWFHISEFLITAEFKPDSVNFDSFLLNHSTAYTLAFVLAQVEFWLELAFLPFIKGHVLLILMGLVICVFGLYCRFMAMATAKSNFSHVIETSRRKEHQLVTTGIYRTIRHPAYMGWFCWSIGTQVLLSNPLCCVFYAVLSWNFFKDRIP